MLKEVEMTSIVVWSVDERDLQGNIMVKGVRKARMIDQLKLKLGSSALTNYALDCRFFEVVHLRIFFIILILKQLIYLINRGHLFLLDVKKVVS